MSRNQEITVYADEIIKDIISNLSPLPNILMKAERLAILLNNQTLANQFRSWAKDAEYKVFEIGAYTTEMEAAKDPDVSIHSSNPNQYVMSRPGNQLERTALRKNVRQAQSALAAYRTEAHAYALSIYTKWQFGNIAESVFEKKRQRTDPILQEIFPDFHERIKSIEENLLSDKDEHWKNAVVSCRTLLMDLADTLNPSTTRQKDDYINRLKTYISPKIESTTKKKLIKTYLEEIKKRIEYATNMTQGPAHKDRPSQEEAESIVLYTYLNISELMEAYRQSKTTE